MCSTVPVSANNADSLKSITAAACPSLSNCSIASIAACTSLAQRLFAWDVSDRELDVFYGAASTYAEILGPKGLQAYRALAEAEWANVPARTAEGKELAGYANELKTLARKGRLP